MVEICAASPSPFGAPPASGAWQAKLDLRHSNAYRMFQDWLNQHATGCSQPPFRCLSLQVHRLSDWPCLKCKATNSSLVSAWLQTMACHVKSTEFGLVRLIVLEAFNQIWEMIQQTKFPNHILSGSQRAGLERLREVALLGYHWLSKECASRNMCHYRIRPKFHRWDKGLRRAVRTGVSPSVYYTFSPEDMMGITARACSKIHSSTIMRRGFGRWLLSFFIPRSHIFVKRRRMSA